MANTFKGNKLIYIPVTSTPKENLEYPPDDINLGKGKKLNWWYENSLLPYNAMLVSAYIGMSNIKNRSQIRDDVLFFGDSGGYQILKYYLGKLNDPNIFKKLTWEKVIKWQMKVCDIGMTLDHPTSRTWVETKNKKIFEDRLKQSKKNALAMLDYKDKYIEEAYNPDFKLFNCIHGEFYDDMERWYRETTDNYNIEYDGFSLSTSTKMRYILPLRLGFAMEHSTGKPFHLLGISSPSSLSLMAYANKYIKTQVYFDSKTASLGRMIRKYMNIWDFAGDGFKLYENPKYDDFSAPPCDCPVCKQLKRPEDLWESGTTSGILITLHNLFWMANYAEFISNYVYCKDEFVNYIRQIALDPHDDPHRHPKSSKKSNGVSWLLSYIEFLDYVHENDLQTAWNKYFKRKESTDLLIFDESNKENCDILMLNPTYNSKIRKLQKNSMAVATKECKDMMKKEILNPHTKEIVKIGELVEEDIAEISRSLRIYPQKNSKKIGRSVKYQKMKGNNE